MEYRTKSLRAKEAEWSDCGGIEGMYSYLRAKRQTREQIAETFDMSVSALARWVTRWNKAKKEQEREQVNP